MPETQTHARKALEQLEGWKISELPQNAAPAVVATRFSAAIREAGLLPDSERNDGIILAEASLGGAALLITSDNHLRDVDHDALRLLFESRDMAPISAVSPVKLCPLLAKRGSR